MRLAQPLSLVMLTLALLAPTLAPGTPDRGGDPFVTAAAEGVANLPNDPGFERQWHLQGRAVAGSADWAPAFASGLTGAGVIVAVVDSGVSPNPELSTLLPGRSFIGEAGDTSDGNGHGTFVAGAVAQTTNDSAGLAGVASGASVLPVKVLDANTMGTASGIRAGVAWAVERGARVFNLSLVGSDPSICASVDAALRADAVVVAAAGNHGGAVSYPAACPGVIAVAASRLDGSIAPYSGHGPSIAIAAPGGDLTTDANGDGAPDGIVQYTVRGGESGAVAYAGTSMAAPLVAGAAALLLEARPGLSAAAVADLLKRTATDSGAPGRDDRFGAGILDIAAAVDAVRALPHQPPVTAANGARGDTRGVTTGSTGPVLTKGPAAKGAVVGSVTRTAAKKRCATKGKRRCAPPARRR